MTNSVTSEFHVLDAGERDPVLVCRSLSAELAHTLCSTVRAGFGELDGGYFKWGKPYPSYTQTHLPGVMIQIVSRPIPTPIAGFAFRVARAEGRPERVEGWLIGRQCAIDKAWDDATHPHPFRAQTAPEFVPCLLLRTAEVDPKAAGPMRDQAIDIAAAWLALEQ